MAVTAVVFDIGETLVDETGLWQRAADAAGVPRFTVMGVLGGLAARGEHHARVWDILGVERPRSTWDENDLYPDALPCLQRLRAQRLVVGGTANHVRRGAWGLLHDAPPGALRIESLDELPAVLGG